MSAIIMKPLVVSRFILLVTAIFCLTTIGRTASAEEQGGISIPSLFDPRDKAFPPDLATLPGIRFATTVDFPPFNYLDQSGKLLGFHVELAREICRELKITERCQIEAMPFGDLQARLEKGIVDASIAGIRITPELRERFAFSRPYMMLPARFVAAKAETGGPSDLKPGDAGVVGNTLHQTMAEHFFPDLKPRPYANRAALLEALRKKEIKAAFGDAVQLSFWVEAPASEDCCRLFGEPYYSSHYLGEGLALMSRKDQPQITQAIDYALIALARNGRLNELYLRYFPNGL
ncbi:transporter substrate-binding domain-containing protein [Rhizobium alvei]|uniref:Transporter substrate-binding domain-containing protein n=1 Tax=Rhizobium alvei TaxID=1132659 RepID=A0ABT8YLC8_9HYPH|nr:transporter substrate-binding domain-containing protein [Rhizobium alvei]MDO6964534.1 transporter substrate-binding domain-containing protein [Rhizobium alvei]